ncbi:MAG: hypothetical protein J7K58_01280 [Euryarchaeota archaeon]|nr:hypothetical protein [Euryarchaeota archaeon]
MPGSDDFLYDSNEEMEVLRSDGTAEKWDKYKILNSLLRETNISKDAATIITREVEKLIKTMDLRTIPAPLIRELVNAKLIEYGLTEVRRYYTRVGVPVYDAQSIIINESSPKKSSEVLARKIKREFSLVRLYSSDVVSAYHRKVLHVNGIEMPDGFFEVALDLDSLKKNGVRIPDLKITLKPARRTRTFVNQVLVYSEITKYHTVSTIYWNDFNYVLAPYIEKEHLGEDDLRDLAQSILFELYTREIPVTIVLSTEPPTAPAFGPKGERIGEYRDFDEIAQTFASVIVEEFSKGDGLGGSFDKYVKIIVKGTPRKDLLKDYIFFSKDTILPHKARYSRNSYAIVEEISLNLIKIAEEARNDEEKYLEGIEKYKMLALKALGEKLEFLSKVNIKNTIPDVESWEKYNAVSLYGTRESIMKITGEDPIEDKSSFKILKKVLDVISKDRTFVLNYSCPREAIFRFSSAPKGENEMSKEVLSLTEGISLSRAINIFKEVQDYFDLDVYMDVYLSPSWDVVLKVSRAGIYGVHFNHRR